MTSKQRAFLKKEAHNLEPIVRIGKDGLSDNIVQSLLDAINSRELIKVKVLQNLDADKDDTREMAEELSRKSGAELVGVIGKIIIFYKENKDKPVVSALLRKIK
ncbi:MAG: ribosome assembly RNA-binding protein YhbY [Fusobacteriaceae bacterium]|jgi:RNA-binding protein|nr:ribosome assembly RNA-binding protein YhbY [Fusobacteriaceae bacterium]MBP6466801.1 ribosome assembly RNA-binding protein YhbY [Fusobacteriaceae bacterium]MBP9595714.1 ribosome assembly RNA-binding protein YhbY [Fusobacteriaceae bacterium]MBU9916995.1 ribosome assembly RNA-binding protein YhbY [Fusobacteriaceae bacterium]